MKVIYKKSILDKIQGVIDNAVENGDKIDHIVLDKKEWLDFICEVRRSSPGIIPADVRELNFIGLNIRKGDC